MEQPPLPPRARVNRGTRKARARGADAVKVTHILLPVGRIRNARHSYTCRYHSDRYEGKDYVSIIQHLKQVINGDADIGGDPFVAGRTPYSTSAISIVKIRVIMPSQNSRPTLPSAPKARATQTVLTAHSLTTR